MSEHESLTSLGEAFEGSINFYDIAEIKHSPLESQSNPNTKEERIFTFLLETQDTEKRWLYLVSIDRDLAPEPFMELGNILASRLSQRLSQQENQTISLTPPREITDLAWKRLQSRFEIHQKSFKQNFTYIEKNNKSFLVPVKTFLTSILRS